MEREEIDQLVAGADRRALYVNQVEHAKERYCALNVLAWEGHIFELTPTFVSFVLLQFMSSQHDGDTPVILLDKNDEPLLVENVEEFVDQMQERHTEAINEYHDTYRKLRLAQNNQELIEAA